MCCCNHYALLDYLSVLCVAIFCCLPLLLMRHYAPKFAYKCVHIWDKTVICHSLSDPTHPHPHPHFTSIRYCIHTAEGIQSIPKFWGEEFKGDVQGMGHPEKDAPSGEQSSLWLWWHWLTTVKCQRIRLHHLTNTRAGIRWRDGRGFRTIDRFQTPFAVTILASLYSQHSTKTVNLSSFSAMSRSSGSYFRTLTLTIS